MTIAVWGSLAFLALLLQPKVLLFDCPLNLTLALVYAFGLRRAAQQSGASGYTDVSAESKSTVFGACIGLAEDVLGGILTGPNVLSKGLAGFAGSVIFRDVFFRWESVAGGVVLFVLTLVDGIIVLSARQLFTDTAMGGHAAILVVLQAILNIPLGLIISPGQKIALDTTWSHGKRYN